jgi:Ni/Co efflux regulator RcnB
MTTRLKKFRAHLIIGAMTSVVVAMHAASAAAFCPPGKVCVSPPPPPPPRPVPQVVRPTPIRPASPTGGATKTFTPRQVGGASSGGATRTFTPGSSGGRASSGATRTFTPNGRAEGGGETTRTFTPNSGGGASSGREFSGGQRQFSGGSTPASGRQFGAAPSSGRQFSGGPAKGGYVHPLTRAGDGRTYAYHGQRLAPVLVRHYAWPAHVTYHRYVRGVRFPRRFWIARYVLWDFADYGLSLPGDDLEWIRFGPDLLLIDTTTGEVSDAIYGFFEESDDAPDDQPDE